MRQIEWAVAGSLFKARTRAARWEAIAGRLRDRAGRRVEMATRSTNRGLSQSFRTAGAHEQADGDAGDHALPVAASGRGGVGRVAALVMSAGKSVDFTGIGGPQRNDPSARGALEPSS